MKILLLDSLLLWLVVSLLLWLVALAAFGFFWLCLTESSKAMQQIDKVENDEVDDLGHGCR